MNAVIIIGIIILIVIILFFVFLRNVVFARVFYNSDAWKKEPFTFPADPQYDPYKERITELVKGVVEQPFEEVTITSHDGLTLYGRYYHMQDNAPMHIQFHGYRGAAQREFGGCRQCEWELGVNTLLVDQRGHGKSGGNVMTFGILEQYDCQSWARYAAERFGPDVPLILSGVSMGAATVLMASCLELPGSVAGIIADSPYDSPKDIICTVIDRMKLPRNFVWNLIHLSARIFGHVDLESASALSAVKKTRLPVLIYHSDADKMVPVEMSCKLKEAGGDKVQLEVFPGGAHGISFLVDEGRYLEIMKEFMRKTAGLGS